MQVEHEDLCEEITEGITTPVYIQDTGIPSSEEISRRSVRNFRCWLNKPLTWGSTLIMCQRTSRRQERRMKKWIPSQLKSTSHCKTSVLWNTGLRRLWTDVSHFLFNNGSCCSLHNVIICGTCWGPVLRTKKSFKIFWSIVFSIWRCLTELLFPTNVYRYMKWQKKLLLSRRRLTKFLTAAVSVLI